MRHSAALLAALLALKALVYLPLAAFALLGWRTCGRDALAAPAMVAVQGRLDQVAYLGNRPNRGFHVAYTYRFGAQERTGHAMTFCGGWSAGSVIDDLPRMRGQLESLAGRPVTVWVDPAHPENAVLFRYLPRAALVVLGGGLLFLSIVAVSADRRWSRRLRQRHAPQFH